MGNPGESQITVIYDGMDVTGATMSVDWSGDKRDFTRELSVTLINTSDGRNRLIDIENGRPIQFLNYGKELFYGVVFKNEINTDGRHSITAYEESVYLNKNKASYKFKGRTASHVLKRICGDYGIPTGEIENTGFYIPKLIMEDKSLYDIIVTALTITRKQTGRDFVITSEGGAINLRLRTKQVSEWVIESGSNVLNARYSQSIENTKTRVRVVANKRNGDDSDKSELLALKDGQFADRFGIMEHVEKPDRDLNSSEALQLAEQLLADLETIEDEATVEVIGIDDVIAGKGVYVSVPLTGIAGGYYVTEDKHRFEKGIHTMSLTLSATDELPTLVYEPPNNKEEGGL